MMVTGKRAAKARDDGVAEYYIAFYIRHANMKQFVWCNFDIQNCCFIHQISTVSHFVSKCWPLFIGFERTFNSRMQCVIVLIVHVLMADLFTLFNIHFLNCYLSPLHSLAGQEKKRNLWAMHNSTHTNSQNMSIL